MTDTRTIADPPLPPPGESRPQAPRAGVAGPRLVAAISAAIGILLAITIPFLPVRQTEASVSWPQNGTTAGVTAPLVSYAPTALDIAIPCTAVDRLAGTGGVLVSTAPIGAPDTERYGLVAKVVTDSDPHRVDVVARDRVLLSAPLTDLGPGCTIVVHSSPTGTSATVGSVTGAVDDDLRPQVVGVFSQLTGPPPDGLAVTAQLDTRFTTSPTPIKIAAMLLTVLATAVSLVALHRIDAADGRRTRRFLPARWWTFTRIDALVVGTLAVWHVIGANTADDGYQLGMARAAGEAGYMANYFRWFGVPEAPFGTPFYDVLAWMTHVSTASIWMRLPALCAGLLGWWLISREVAPRLGAAARASRGPLWTGALVFLAFWLPFNNGLRPEPIVAVGVLATWCSVERAVATRRLLPAAAAVVIGAITVTAGPSGIICFAALIAGARPVARIVAARARTAGYAATLLPLVASGLAVLTFAFADQTAAAVIEMQKVHAIGPDVPWYMEYLRYQYLLQITVDGSLSRRFAMFTMFLCLVTVIVAMLRRGGQIPGTSQGPTRRIVGVTLGALVLMMFAPTKWTHHFGIYAGLAAGVAIVAAVAVSPAVLRSRRNRALFAAAVAFVVTMSFVSTNGWWYVSSYGVPWWDKPPSVAGFGFATAFLALTVLLLAVAAWYHVHPTADRRRDAGRGWAIPPLTVAAAALVLFEVLSLAKGAIAQYPAYSVARSNVDALTGDGCGLANDVLLETDPNASTLRPLSGDVGGALAAGGAVGFTPNGVASDLTPDDEDLAAGTANTVDRTSDAQSSAGAGTGGGFGGRGVNGSTVALPFGLDPATTPVLGSNGASGAANATTDWYRLPDTDAAGSRGDLISIAVAGRVHSVDADGIDTYGQRLDVEYGATEADGTVRPLGSTTPIDIGPAPSWRNLRVPMDRLPAEADVVRIVAADTDISGDQWLAFTPPRVPQTQTLQEVVGTRTPVLLDWAVGLNFPCQAQMLHRNGVAQVPAYRILPDRHGAISTNLWQDHNGGGPLGWTGLLLGARTIPSYLAHDWDRDWGSIEQFVPIDRGAGPASIETDTAVRSGWWTPGPIITAY
ncbi:arabinosyltransferase domain-containing protein [Rhodococcus olei]|uniref:Arabinosyltransferase domain-containing protein n=1 Tax=Rhodococcus olei TaxID=2161675 RepID=A0ABP8P3Y8_9NOCA